jgi:putative aldouronate transport system substrate-binding protein
MAEHEPELDPTGAENVASISTTRREFLALVGAGGLTGLVPGCSRPASAHGVATSAAEVAAVLPAYRPTVLVTPDIEARGPIPAGYLTYPGSRVRVIGEKPGRSGRSIRSMTAWWGPAPLGAGRNAFVDAVNLELGVPVNPSVQDGNAFGDKLSAILGARDVPDLLSVPAWEIDKIPRFGDAVKALFTDLSEYLKGEAVGAYPMLASIPTTAWQYSVWGGRLAAIPYPTSGPFPLALFYRKDLSDRAGIPAPKSMDEFYAFGKAMTRPSEGVWAFGSVFNLVQMYFKCPGVKGGWRRRAGGSLEFKYELPEYERAVEFTARLFKEGLIHPDFVETRGADAKQLFNAGRIVAYEDGLGAWLGMQREQQKITPGFLMQPVPVFAADGGTPLAWGGQEPFFYTFLKKGLGRERTEELLRVLNWCAAPFGSAEYELASYGVEGMHFTRAADGSPVPTDLGSKEVAEQFRLIGGRAPVEVATADVPHYMEDMLAYEQRTLPYLEDDIFTGIKITLPANYSKTITVTEDKLSDLLRGRRPMSDLKQIVREWRNAGGDEGRAFLERTLADSRR